MFRRFVSILLVLLVAGAVLAPVATAQYGDDAAATTSESAEEAWRPKENFWWLFASYGVIWVAVLGYVGRMGGRQRELERELARLESEIAR